MCVILDASARDDVFGQGRTTVGKEFFEWLETRQALLVLGGHLTDELVGSRAFERWAETAINDGRIKVFDKNEVDRETDVLAGSWLGQSDDQHVIALARVSRARILYASDVDLREDFKNPALVANPYGRLYPTGDSKNATKHRRQLLNQIKFCPNR